MDPVRFFAEMRRRNVFRVAGTFLVGSWFMVQTAYTLESVMKLPEWFDGIFLAIMFLGFPVVVILAWAFELTPEGFKRTEIVSREDSIAAKTGKRLDIAIAVGMVLIAGLLIWDRVAPSDRVRVASLSGNQSVAVLPFSNRSPDVADAYFADGIHDDLLTKLAKIASMEVISRTSVMGYRETDKKIPTIAEELGVAAILEGAVQRAGTRVRITVQLIDGKDDTHLWAETYDRALTTENIFDIQAEITQVIAASLEAVISGDDTAALSDEPTQNIDAYEAYIQGKVSARIDGSNEDGLRAGLPDFERAIALDPNFTEAHARKARTYLALYWFHGRHDLDLITAKKALDRAQKLDADNVETLLAEAFYNYWGRRDFVRANNGFDKALHIAPNHVEALSGKAFIARRLGQFEAAATGLAKAHRLDPLSFYLIPELGLTYALIGDFDKADTMIARAAEINSNSLQGAAFAAAIYQFQGKPQKAYDAISSTGAALMAQKFNYALVTQNPEIIEQTLAEWPEATRGEVLYTIAQIKAASILGNQAEVDAKLAALNIDHAAKREQDGPEYDWSGAAEVSPVVIPGLLGDGETVRAAAKAYDALDRRDAMTALSQLGELAEAFARIGDLDRAMDYVDQMRDLMGPHIILLLEKDPILNPLREHPRYVQYKADYDAVLSGQ